MEKLKVAIVDDEWHCLETLKWQLNIYCPDLEVVGMFKSPLDFLKFKMNNAIDLLFLDIEMPVLNGFDLLSSLPIPDFALVFTTASDEFAIQAIKNNAIDYLLKPIDHEKLIAAAKNAHKGRSDLNVRLNKLMSDMELNVANNLAMPTSKGIELVDPKQILHCEEESHCTIVFLESGSELNSYLPLKDIEYQLSEEHFIRVHQSHLVNVHHVIRYVPGDNSHVILSDNSKVPVSQGKMVEVVERLA